jgi:hypothetical protein
LRLSPAPKRSVDAIIESATEAESSNKKQKTSDAVEEGAQAPVQVDEDEPPEKEGKGSHFKELPYVFLPEDSKHLEQAMYVDSSLKPR